MIEEKKQGSSILLFITILSFIGGCISYFYLVKDIPMQWDLNWEVSKSAPKEAVFILSAVPFLLYILMSNGILSKRSRDAQGKGSQITTIVITYLLIILQWISIAVALDVAINIKLFFPLLIGIAFIVIGNFMPTVKRNYLIGFRTPWSIRNDISWKKTNRFGGYCISILGILMIIYGAFQNELLLKVIIVISVIVVVSGFYYSYRLRDAK